MSSPSVALIGPGAIGLALAAGLTVVVRTLDKHGIEVPLNRTVTTLMRLGEPDFNTERES